MNEQIIRTMGNKDDLVVSYLNCSQEAIQPIVDTAFTQEETKSKTGANTTWLMDCRKGLSKTENLQAAADWFVEILDKQNINQIVVKGYGAYFLAGSVLTTSYNPISGSIIREERKEYALKKKIEGSLDRSKPVLLIDDIINSGSSTLDALNALQMPANLVHCAFLLSFKWGKGAVALNKRGYFNKIHIAAEVRYR